MEERFSRAAALRFGWEATKRNLGLFVALAFVTVLVSLFFNALQSLAERSSALAALLVLLHDIASIFLSMVWTRVALDVVDGRPVRFLPEHDAPRIFARYLAATILFTIAVVVGLALLIVPGIYLAVRYALFGFLIVDKGREPLEAFHESAQLTAGSRFSLFLLGLALFAINLLGALLFGIGLLIAIPITTLAAVYVYRRLEARAPVEAMPLTKAPAPTA